MEPSRTRERARLQRGGGTCAAAAADEAEEACRGAPRRARAPWRASGATCRPRPPSARSPARARPIRRPAAPSDAAEEALGGADGSGTLEVGAENADGRCTWGGTLRELVGVLAEEEAAFIGDAQEEAVSFRRR